MTQKENILLFEPDSDGHHPGYLYHLVINFLKHEYDYDLVILVAPDFSEKHTNIIEKTISEKVIWLSFSEIEFKQWKLIKSKSVIKRAFFEWSLLRKYIIETKAVYTLLMYFDYLQIPLLVQKPLPCPISGILFRPTLVNYPFNSIKERLNTWRKNLMLRLCVKNVQLYSLFSLDSFATEYIEQNWHTKKVKFLPDPIQIYPTTKSAFELKQSFDIDENRKVFLIFGFLDSRKGITEIIEAIAKIPNEIAQKGTLLIVGPWEKDEHNEFDNKVSKIRGMSDFQIIVKEGFVHDEDIQQYFEVTDFVFALYSKHIGMSANMVRAAAANKPLITYNFGLMGKLVVENQLGIIIENDLVEKIEVLLTQNNDIGDKEKMNEFASINNAKNYANVILKHLSDFASSYSK